MPVPNDPGRCRTALDPESTLIAVIEMSQSSWLVSAIVPGLERHPLKKLAVDEAGLLRQLERWREEAARAGRRVTRIAVAFEAGRDGFWLARWLRARGVEAHVIHPTSIAVSREHRRAKTDRLDTELLKRAFLGWLRGERDHCSMAAVPSLEEEDARRPNREREALVAERTRVINRIRGCLARLGIRGFKPTLRRAPERLEDLRTPEGDALPPNTLSELRRDMARLRLIRDQVEELEAARAERLEAAPASGQNAMVRLLARVIGVGVETADMLVHEVLSRGLRDRRAVARYAGLTGAPDESGARRREKGLAKAGNARVRRGMIQLAWRFLAFQKQSALAQWYRARTADARPGTRKTLIVALARKLLLALWRFATTGQPPAGVALRPGMTAAGWEAKNKFGACRSVAGADNGPRWRSPDENYGFDAACETGPAAPELRRRCAWLHHGSGPTGPTEYKFVARSVALKAGSPQTVLCNRLTCSTQR
jgi:transposase